MPISPGRLTVDTAAFLATPGVSQVVMAAYLTRLTFGFADISQRHNVTQAFGQFCIPRLQMPHWASQRLTCARLARQAAQSAQPGRPAMSALMKFHILQSLL